MSVEAVFYAPSAAYYSAADVHVVVEFVLLQRAAYRPALLMALVAFSLMHAISLPSCEAKPPAIGRMRGHAHNGSGGRRR